MLFKFAKDMFARKQKIPEHYARMLRSEYRNVPFDYVEYYMQTYKRLPTLKELQNAI
jgi:hypothetical protein